MRRVKAIESFPTGLFSTLLLRNARFSTGWITCDLPVSWASLPSMFSHGGPAQVEPYPTQTQELMENLRFIV